MDALYQLSYRGINTREYSKYSGRCHYKKGPPLALRIKTAVRMDGELVAEQRISVIVVVAVAGR